MNNERNINSITEGTEGTAETEAQSAGSFEYTYSAPTEIERAEIASIRRQYQDKSAVTTDKSDKLARLRLLDARVKNTATAIGLVLGIIGTLIFGLGMSMVLEWGLFLWGVLVSAVGCAPILAAYPVYNLSLKKGKEKYGEEILKLSEELLEE